MSNNKLTVSQLAQFFDYTLLKPYASREDFEFGAAECKKYGFKMIAINSAPTALCKELLKDSEVHVGATAGFPFGQMTIEAKVFETQDAIHNGADEIDYVMNITELKNGNYDYVRREMEEIVALCAKNNVISKVIFENCYLTKEEIIKMSEIAREVGPDFIKTSTGYAPGGATLEDIKLMKSVVGDKVKVKAAGGVRTLDACLEMIEAGVERIGSSNCVGIIKEYEERLIQQSVH